VAGVRDRAGGPARPGRGGAPAPRAAPGGARPPRPPDPAPYVAQGNLDLVDGNAEGAAESFRGALARDADNATAQTNLGVALARLGRAREATEAFEQATRRAPHQGQAWNGLGAMRLSANDFLGAIGPLQQASALLPGDPNPPMNLGLAFEGLQRWTEAVHAFREALRRAPGMTAATAHILRLVPAESRPGELRRMQLAQR
jgi:Flp pilus assembly protein TadD